MPILFLSSCGPTIQNEIAQSAAIASGSKVAVEEVKNTTRKLQKVPEYPERCEKLWFAQVTAQDIITGEAVPIYDIALNDANNQILSCAIWFKETFGEDASFVIN